MADDGGGGKKSGRGRGRGQKKTGAPAPGHEEKVEEAIGALSLEEKTSPPPSTIPKSTMSTPPEETEQSNRSLVLRPGIGTKGRQIKLVANHFPFTIPPNMVVQHYDMAVLRQVSSGKEPKSEKKESLRKKETKEIEKLPKFLFTKICTTLMEKNRDVFPDRHTIAFDGNKNIFSKTKLPMIDKAGRSFKVTVKNEEKRIDEEFIVHVKHVAQVDVDLRSVFNRNLVERKSVATLVLDVVLKQTTMFNPYYVPFGSRIFYQPEPGEMYPLGAGIVRFPGFWQSIRPVSGWKAMLNLDQANTAFVKDDCVLTILQNEFKCNPANVRESECRAIARQLNKLIKGLKVKMTQRGEGNHRTAKCISVTRESANQLKFAVRIANEPRERMISVAEYFQIMYNNKEFTQNIKYPNLPCLHTGSPNKKNYVPLEFCVIKEGQRYPKKLNDQETSNMLRYASQPAPERRRKIQADANFMKFNEDPFLKGFGFTVSLKMADVTGRVLNPPALEYENQQILPKEGGWNMRDVKVINGCHIRNFAVICTVKCDPTYFVTQWVGVARGMGFQVESNNASKIINEFYADNMESRVKELKDTIPNLDLVFVVLRSQNTDFYGSAKCAGDVLYGVNTQCVQLKNVTTAKPAMLANLCLKINGKLGGVNSKLQNSAEQQIKHFMTEPILFLGADVNHPSPGESDEPISCAAVVGNVDVYPSLYSARILLQHREEFKDGKSLKRPQEWIANMKDAVKMIIEHFVERNRIMPRRIIMYRDGVGETMFLQVLTKELTAIRLACEEMEMRFPEYAKKAGFENKYEPPITFIVVQKRHHTRLFCADDRDAKGRGQNVPPGTTVDTDIVHPEEFDFYLCSHLGIQGTSRPAHYHVLYDDSNFSADDLETLTYYLCHTYVRATRSVSIPPPCYYADLVAYRARKYLESRSGGSSDSASVSTGSVRSRSSISDLQRYVNVSDDIVKRGMFFV